MVKAAQIILCIVQIQLCMVAQLILQLLMLQLVKIIF